MLARGEDMGRLAGVEPLQVIGAEEGIRTPTVLLPPAPQAGASASSATSAWGRTVSIFQRVRREQPMRAWNRTSNVQATAVRHVSKCCATGPPPSVDGAGADTRV